ncbi:uncharacterized protein BXZ73DRAFT_73785 [Epithele typhae]|uniref:uncharacterized protein n=1 Tax=Epithele typhae TaxID=378194 RepID=UPI002007E961|nr:uncharacterized protein BXZ73DRAFT_73785 [Epithele typhae]KAH9944213.1 hypothetical protein BXZ73DRAFT_73785 [Epithele typhae]
MTVADPLTAPEDRQERHDLVPEQATGQAAQGQGGEGSGCGDWFSVSEGLPPKAQGQRKYGRDCCFSSGDQEFYCELDRRRDDAICYYHPSSRGCLCLDQTHTVFSQRSTACPPAILPRPTDASDPSLGSTGSGFPPPTFTNPWLVSLRAPHTLPSHLESRRHTTASLDRSSPAPTSPQPSTPPFADASNRALWLTHPPRKPTLEWACARSAARRSLGFRRGSGAAPVYLDEDDSAGENGGFEADPLASQDRSPLGGALSHDLPPDLVFGASLLLTLKHSVDIL